VVVVRVIVIGAGEVGRSIAANLSSGHEVVVVDQDPEIVEELTYSLDVLALQGDGTDLAVLQEANLDAADMVIACTDDDEANIVACGAAKTAGDVFTIGRVARHSLLQTWQRSQGAFGVDFMVCTDLLAAEAIVRISGMPGVHDADTFAGGLIRMAEVEVDDASAVAGQTVREADRYDSLTFAAIFREDAVDDELIVPRGETVIEGGDRLVVIGSLDAVQTFADDMTPGTETGVKEVVIVGGGEIGYQTARLFGEYGARARLIEHEHDRARELAERLPDTVVLESDATDTEFLAREHVDEADVVVACLGSDEKNLLVSLLARELGVTRTVAIVGTAQYADLFETVGVDVAVSPREETAEEIVRFTRGGQTQKVAMLEHDRAEVLEMVLDAGSPLVGSKIAEAVPELPDGVVVGAVSRNGEHVTPRGDTVLEPDDHVVLFVDSDVLEAVTERL
jgi:trk system potassium uptake protein TrkA